MKQPRMTWLLVAVTAAATLLCAGCAGTESRVGLTTNEGPRVIETDRNY